MDVLILGGARTPWATWARGTRGDGAPGGALKDFDAFDLGATALKGALNRCGVAPERVERVVFSNMYYAGSHGCYGARYVGLRAGLPESVPCLSLSMACGSGLQAVIEAAQDVAGGEAGLVAAGGADNISLLRKDVFVPSFFDLACGKPIGETVEALAAEFAITREAADRWARLSHERALAARKAGAFAREIVPLGAAQEDDFILAEPAERHFAEAKAAHAGGVVGPANTHALVDGGAALLLASQEAARAAGAKPRGRFVAGAYAALAPARMGYASVPAVEAVLAKAGWRAADVDLYEINETFAVQMLIDLAALKLPEERVNVRGGAIALGHPFAATGPRLVLSLLDALRERGGRRGIASISIGGGQGVALAVEAV